MLSIPIIIVAVLSAICIFTGQPIFEIPTDPSFHFGLITVSSIFAGFLFTNYSLLPGIVQTELGKKIEATNLIDNRNQYIQHGIRCAVISILAGVFLSIDFSENIDEFVTNKLVCLPNILIYTEIVFMIFTVIFFTVSMYKMNILIKATYRNSDKKPYTKSKVNKLKELFGKPKSPK